MSVNKYQIALVGNPNVGKSSVFNLLTGLQQKVGNFPGVTVDKKSGSFLIENNISVKVIDLPGLYSLFPTSEDERVVVDVLLENLRKPSIDLILYIIDANDLERNLLLFSQIKDLNYKMIVGVNMMDTAQSNGLEINLVGLSESFGVPFIPVNGRSGEGIEEVKKIISHQILYGELVTFYNMDESEAQIVRDIQTFIPHTSSYEALLIAHHYKRLHQISAHEKEFISKLINQYSFNSLDHQLDEMMKRFQLITPLVVHNVKRHLSSINPITKKIDTVLTHPFFGLIIFLVIMMLVFQSIFTWSEMPMEFVERSFSGLSNLLIQWIPDGWLQDLLTQGIISGLSGVFVFVPQIAILFFLISLLEESGYMARVVYMMDHFMRRFGLNGRSVVSLISGGACSIPAIMSTRTINNWKERLITIMVTPLISCSARIPVFTILIAVSVPPTKLGGWLNLQAVVFMALYFLGAFTALFVAWLFHKILKTDEQSFLLMELPRYQMPHWRNVFLNVIEKIKTFSIEAGRVILLVSIILWFLASFGPRKNMEAAKVQAQKEYNISQDISLKQLTKTHQLEASYAGTLGKFIEPVIRPLGYDWKIGIALISSFAAREVFVGTMATLYAVEDGNNQALLTERLQNATNKNTGKKVFTLATAMSLMIFYLYAMQCVSTMAVVKRETKSWKWPIFQFIYMGVLAYIGSWIVFQIFS
jgi:ferrous iron transport protein B